MDINDFSQVGLTQEQQAEALQQAKEAAAAGEAFGMVVALHRSGLLDGLARWVAGKWPRIQRDDVGWIVSQAVDGLYAAVQRGTIIPKLEAYLFRIAHLKAYEYHEMHQPLVTDPTQLENVGVRIDGRTPWSEAEDAELEEEDKTAQAIQIARTLLPQIGQENPRRVVGYLLDAYSAGHWEVTYPEIMEALALSYDTVRQSKHRGFERLAERARIAGVCNEDFDFEAFIRGER